MTDRKGRGLFLEKQGTALALFLCMAVGAFARLYGLGEWDYYHDEVWHLYVAQQRTIAGLYYTNLIEDGHPILPYILWRYALMLWDDPLMARLPSFIAGMACIPMGYVLGKELLQTKEGGLFGAFLMAFSSMMIEQSQVVRGYSLMMLFTMVALWSVYRYRKSYSLAWLLLYFVSLMLALLCEFSALPVALFTGLHLLYSLFKRRPFLWLHIIMYGLIHLAALFYIVWFAQQLEQIGLVQRHLAYGYTLPRPISITLAQYRDYYLRLLLEGNVLALPVIALKSLHVGYLLVVFFLSISLVGVHWLIKKRRYDLPLLATILFVAVIVFQELKWIIPLFTRHHMAVLIALIVLFYGGLAHTGQRIVDRWHIKPTSFMMLACFILLGIYTVIGTQWRYQRYFEFHQTRAEIKDELAFLNEHVDKQDAIVMDWGSLYYVWKYIGPCKLSHLSPDVVYYGCYKTPIYFAYYDQRTGIARMTLTDYQRFFTTLYKQQLLQSYRQIWMVSFQHIEIKFTLLDPWFYLRVAYIFRDHSKEGAPLSTEQLEFAQAAYAKANPKKITYIKPCVMADNSVSFKEEDVCVMKFLALSLPKDFIIDRFVHHPPYTDMITLVNEVLLSPSKKQP